jgi:hypothetical protein
LVEVSKKRKEDFEDLMKGNAFSVAGEVKAEPQFSVYGIDENIIIDVSLAGLRDAWKRTLGGGA